MPGLINVDLIGINSNSDTDSLLGLNGGALITLDAGYSVGTIVVSPSPLGNNTISLLREISGIGETGGYEFAEIQISRGLDQHPAATATFYTYNYPLIEIGAPINLLGINFVIASYNSVHYKSTTQQAYAISLSLVGEHSPRGAESPLHPLDIPIRFSENTTQVTWGNIQSRISTPISIGGSSYKKYFAPNSEVILTPRSELDAALLLAGKQSLIYSDPTIRGVDLMTGIGSVTIYIDYVLNETIEASVKEIPIYKNTELELEDFGGEENVDAEITARYEYENCTSFGNLYHPGGSGGIILLSNFAEDLKDPGNVFDNGGRTKTARTIKEKDGNPLRVDEQTWGYVFISSQLFTLPDDIADYNEMVDNGGKWPLNFNSFTVGSVLSYWKQVEKTTTLYFYDSDGYLTSSRKTGWKLGRLKREGGEYEAANLWIDTFYNSATITQSPPQNNVGPPPAWKAKAREYNAYTFYNPIEYAGDNPVFPDINELNSPPLFRYNILERNRYLLADMADYYDDIEIPDGSPPNKFAYVTSSYSNVQEIQPNPKDDPGDPGSPYPPLIAHKERRDSSQTQILCPMTVGADKKTPEIFVTNDYNQSIEGDHSSSSIVIGNSTQYSGRPSVHTKLPDTTERVDLPSGYAEDRTYRYFLNSVTEPPSDPPTYTPALGGGNNTPVPYSSISFSGAVTPNDAQRAAKNALIKKSLDVYTIQIRVMFFKYYQILKEGMKCTFDGQQYIITNISYNLKLVEDGLYYCPEGMNVSLSAIPEHTISMSRYRRRNDSRNSSSASASLRL